MARDTPREPTDSALDELFHYPDRVPLVYWRQFSGARSAVLLTGSAGVLGFVTGLSHLSQGETAFDGPLAPDDRIVVEGLQALRPGIPVRIQAGDGTRAEG